MQGALSKIEGVRSADINLEEQRAVVKHTPETVKPEQLIKVIEEAGFKAKEEPDTLKSKDMGVGLLRFLDISDLVWMVYWPNYTIWSYLKDIVSRRNKLMAHPNVYEQNSQKHTNHIVLREIALCKIYFDKLDRR